MVMVDRIKILWKTTGLTTMLMMGICYGIIFGGVMGISSFVQEEQSIWEAFQQIYASTVIYTGMFLMVIGIVVTSWHIKAYLSLGMDRLTTFKIWRDGIVFISSILTLALIGMVYMMSNDEKTRLIRRYFGLNFNDPSPKEFGLIALMIGMTLLFINLLFSLIAVIANRFGAMICVAASLVFAGLILLAVLLVIPVVTWGDGLLTLLCAMWVLIATMYIIIRKMIMRTEVVR